MRIQKSMIKKVSAFVLVASLAAGLAACGGTTTTTETTTGTTAAPETTTAAPEETTTTGGGEAALVLWGAEDDQEMLKEMATEFVAANPDCTVEVRVTGEDKAKDAALADLDAAADVFAIAHDQLGALAEAGAVYPNTLYAEDIAANDSEAALTAATYDGMVYGYPSSAETYYLYYDKSVFTEEDVMSLDKMLEVATAAEKTVGFDMGNNYFTVAFWFANGCKLFGDSGSDVAGTTFAGPEGVAVAEYIATLGDLGLQNINDGDAEQAFVNGTLAAQVTGSWKTDAYMTALGDNYGVAKLPTVNIGGADKQMISFSGVKLYVVKSNTAFPEQAMKLAAFVTSEENQLKRFNDRKLLPVNLKAAADPAVTADPTIAAQVNQAQFSIPMPSIPQMTNFWSESSMAVTKEIYEGKVEDYATALADWQTLLGSEITS